MNRRQILKYAASLTGTALLAPLVGCSDKVATVKVSSGSLHFFKDKEFSVLTQLIDVILPRTDTPSASDVKVDYVIDQLLGQVFDHEYRKSFTERFTELTTYLEKTDFENISVSKQVALLVELENSPEDQRNNAYLAFIDIKQQTVVHYLSSEEIAENHLNYLPIPGEFKPCVSVEELGNKAWAI